MTPKEKAKELINKFTRFHTNGVYSVVHKDVAKQFALIAVDEILGLTLSKLWYIHNKVDVLNKFYFEYWQEVKQEIEKL